MERKCVVKVIFNKEQREILTELSRRLGTSESETVRMALMDYVEELSLMKVSTAQQQNLNFHQTVRVALGFRFRTCK